jgi:hypothetical protein
MPKLENPKHEEFALHLARGVKQGEAYKLAGYAENKGAASHLARSPVVQERVEELRREISQKIQNAMTIQSEENWASLAEMGLTMEWVAKQYQLIYSQALEAGAFPAANTAVQNIQKLIEMERNAAPEDQQRNDSRINMSDMLSVLEKVGDIVKHSHLPAPDPVESSDLVVINADEFMKTINNG